MEPRQDIQVSRLSEDWEMKNHVLRQFRDKSHVSRLHHCCYPIISCFIKIQIDLAVWCRFTQVVLEKRLSNGCLQIPRLTNLLTGCVHYNLKAKCWAGLNLILPEWSVISFITRLHALTTAQCLQWHDYSQGRNHRGRHGGRVPRAPYHVPPTSKWQQTVYLRNWLDEWRGVVLQRIIRSTQLLHVINHYTTCCF